METHQLKETLQAFMSDGLLIIVGAGLSVAEGISGMPALASYLRKEMPALLDSDQQKIWKPIGDAIAAGTDLESALGAHPLTQVVEDAIVSLTSQLIAEDEMKVVAAAMGGGNDCRLSKLLGRCLRPKSGIPIITTNYDRLVEIAAQQAGLGVDTLFTTGDWGTLDPKVSRFAHCIGIEHRGRRPRLSFRPRVVVMKPHGSLDWYQTQSGPIRCTLPLKLPRMIITPGIHKYRAGYESPFDTHREKANIGIDNADRFLIVGYGFNDDHLHSHLIPRLKAGRQALVLTRTLSASARQLLADCTSMLCLSRSVDASGNVGTLVSSTNNESIVEGVDWWDVGKFAEEVLGA